MNENEVRDLIVAARDGWKAALEGKPVRDADETFARIDAFLRARPSVSTPPAPAPRCPTCGDLRNAGWTSCMTAEAPYRALWGDPVDGGWYELADALRLHAQRTTPTPPAPADAPCRLCGGSGFVMDGGERTGCRGPIDGHRKPAPADDAGGDYREFTCPQCGSHLWGTSNCNSPYSEWVGHCHGARCRFSWQREKDDDKYFGPYTHPALPLPARREEAASEAVVEAADAYCTGIHDPALRGKEHDKGHVERFGVLLDRWKAYAALRGTRPEGHEAKGGDRG